MKQYLNIIFLAQEWKTYYRKPFYDELIKIINLWSDILIVQQPVCLLGHFFTKFNQKIVGLFVGKYKTTKIEYNVTLFTPVMIFHYNLWIKFKFTAIIDTFFLKIQLNKFLKKNFQNRIAIIWVFEPSFYFLLKKIKYDNLVYDDIYNLNFKSDGTELRNGLFFNKKLIEKSNIVVCTARELYEQCKSLNDNTLLLTNGNAFSRITDTTYLDIPNKLSNINKPIIGYLGNVRDWMDFQLLHYLIRELSDVCFVFISMLNRNVKSDFKKIMKLPSVIWVQYTEQKYLPSYLKNFRVGIIPFKINTFMKSIFPNKFFEYMAMEIPIVTTALPELKMYSDLIGYSYSYNEFLQYCKDAIEGGFKDKVKYYKKLAEENSWEKKAEIINEKLMKLVLNKKEISL